MSRCKLLIVDDDAALRSVVRQIVTQVLSQFEVVGEASNGMEAVELAQKLDPDVIVMDVRMPVLDGIQATRRIKQELGLRAVVVSCTSFSWREIQDSARYAGASFQLQKPLDLEQMRNVLLQAWALAQGVGQRTVSV